MAEVRKKVVEDKYNTSKITKKDPKKDTKNGKKKVEAKEVKKKEEKNEKKSFFTKFRIFCHGVKMEFDKVHWPTKKNMVKYSIAVVAFIILCSIFFYLIDVIFALIQSLFR